MSTRNLTNNETTQTIHEWLNGNLTDNNSIGACCENVEKVPEKKGIYFWFMDPKGYQLLSEKLPIKPLEIKYQKDIDGQIYDLVYLGTAGTGKKGNSNLLERLRWHLCNSHNESSICHGTLSTLRQGIGAMLADDLISNDAEHIVNNFLCKYMVVYWIEYGDDKQSIDNDEKILIKGLKPLLNIKNNPNARANASDNPTKSYRSRRLAVMKSTRNLINCKREDNKTMKNKKTPTENAVSYQDQIIADNNGCIEYTVCIDQDIAEVTRGIDSFPIDRNVNISIFKSVDPNIIFDSWQMRGTSNIYRYFSNPNTNPRHNGIRSKLIKDWMFEKNIEEITVKVCWNISDESNHANKKNKTASKSKHKDDIPPTQSQVDNAIVNKENYSNEIYLIPCSNSKKQGGNQISNMDNLSFHDMLGGCREHLINAYVTLAGNNLDWNHCMPAWQRYNGNRSTIYSNDVSEAIARNPDKILIVSALFGIIRPNDLIPDYDLTMDDRIMLEGFHINNFWKDQHTNCEKCILNKVLQSIKGANPGIEFVNLLTENYQKAFCGFTIYGSVPRRHIPGLINPPEDFGQIRGREHWKQEYLLHRL